MSENNQIGKIELLNGQNYFVWAIRMKVILRAKKLFRTIIEGAIPPECTDLNSAGGKLRLQWEEKNDEAVSILIMSLAANQAGMFAEEFSAKKIWFDLEKMYGGNKKDKIIDATLELKELKMGNKESVDEYLTRARNIITKLNALGGTTEQREISFYITRGINIKLENVAVILRTRRDLDTDEIHEILKEEENRIASQKMPNNNNNSYEEGAFKSRENKKYFKPKEIIKECFICRKKGHIAKYCWFRNKNENKTYKHQDKFKTNNAKTAIKRNEYALKGNEIQNKINNNKNTWSYWNLDSGCSVHMTNEKENLYNITKYRSEISIAESDRVIQATAKGEMRMKIKINDHYNNLWFENVLYVPDLKDNLMSVKEIVRHNNEIRFDRYGATITNNEGYIIAHANENNNMYVIKGNILRENENTQDDKNHKACKTEPENNNNENTEKQTWHRRLGHINYNYMEEMRKNDTVIGLKYKREKNEYCEKCLLGKLTNEPFKENKIKQTNNILELIHIDLCGPMQIETLGKNKYMMVIVDDYSRRVFVELLKTKSDAIKAFTKFKNRRENEKQLKIKRVRSDNGTEFTNREFEELLTREGIKHEKTVKYSPQSNGTAERMNRTLLDMARTMLIDAKLPTKFWGEAILTAAYLRNASYKKNLAGKTPIEIWTGKKANIKHFKIFGCLTYTWIHKVYRGKFDPRAKKGIFTGYSQNKKAYRIYIPEEGKIEETRTAKFCEDKRGIDYATNTNMGNMKWDEIRYQTEDKTQTTQIRKPETEYIITEITKGNEQDNIEEYTENINEQGNTEDMENPIESTENEETNQPETQNYKKRGRPKGTIKGVVQEREQKLKETREKELRNEGARRSNRTNREESQQTVETNKLEIPKTYNEAIQSCDKEKWQKAMEEEMDSLEEHKVWTLIKRKEGMKILRNKWIYNIKENGRYKARLVVMGNNQEKGIDYTETYTPVIKTESVRLIIALAAKFNLKIYRYDVKTAYLHGALQEETYMQIPKGIETSENMVCKLEKSLYGLPQSGRNWNLRLDEKLKQIGLKRLNCDPSIYIDRKGEDFIIMGIYVDDGIIIGTNAKWIKELMDKMKSDFKLREEEGDGTFLGLEIKRKTNGYMISQKDQIKKLLEKQGMRDCNIAKTPVDVNVKLDEHEDSQCVDPTRYRELIGQLSYLSGGTRPDITFGVNRLAQFNNNPKELHMTAAKRIVRYLKGTINMKLHYNDDQGQIEASCDASWNTTADNKSHTGYCVKLGNSLITWKTKKQELVALSTCEAELNSICEVVKEVKWIKNLLMELKMEKYILEPTNIFTDSRSAIDWSQGLCVRQRTKHFDRKLYMIREEIEGGTIKLTHVPGEEIEADALTKGVNMVKLQNMQSKVNLY